MAAAVLSPGRRLRRLHPGALRDAATALVGVLAVGVILLAVHPAAVAAALGRLSVPVMVLAVGLSLGYCALQAIRWHLLLCAVGARLPLRDTVLLTVAARSTSLLPVGELTRAVLVCEVTRAEPGTVVGTIAVQELVYNMLLIAVALPGSFALHAAPLGVGVALAGCIAAVAVLTVTPLYGAVRRTAVRLAPLRPLVPHVDDLQRATAQLLRRPDTLAGSLISAAGAAVAVTLFWLLAASLAPGALSWRDAAFVYTVSHMAGALSMVPGGLGAFDASIVGLLSALGVPPATAAAVAVLAHAADKGVGTAAGALTFELARRRFHLRHRVLLRVLPQSSRPQPPPVTAGATVAPSGAVALRAA